MQAAHWIYNYPVVDQGFRGWGRGPGAIGWGTFLHWRNNKIKVFSYSKGFKKSLKSMKYLKKFENFTGNFAIFENFLKFSQKNRENLENFGNMDL